MDDDQLDTLLREGRRSPSGSAEGAARLLAREVALAGPVRATRRRHRPWVAVAAAIGATTLAAGTTMTAYQLGVPPFQTLEPGLERTVHGVPVDYRTESGVGITCLAFIEFRDVSDVQRRQINGLVSGTDWSGYGQRTYDALPERHRSVDTAPGPVGDVVMEDLAGRAVDAAPGVSIRAPQGPTVTGGAMTCDDDTEVPTGGR